MSRLYITHRHRSTGKLLCRLAWPAQYVTPALLEEVWESAITYDQRGIDTTLDYVEEMAQVAA